MDWKRRTKSTGVAASVASATIKIATANVIASVIQQSKKTPDKSGAPEWGGARYPTRTGDRQFTKLLLYQLS